MRARQVHTKSDYVALRPRAFAPKVNRSFLILLHVAIWQRLVSECCQNSTPQKLACEKLFFGKFKRPAIWPDYDES